jgi:hypothetical protein
MLARNSKRAAAVPLIVHHSTNAGHGGNAAFIDLLMLFVCMSIVVYSWLRRRNLSNS